jgi:hypothetical protein
MFELSTFIRKRSKLIMKPINFYERILLIIIRMFILQFCYKYIWYLSKFFELSFSYTYNNFIAVLLLKIIPLMIYSKKYYASALIIILLLAVTKAFPNDNDQALKCSQISSA